MEQHVTILPPNGTSFEKVIEEASNPLIPLAHRYDNIRAADIATPYEFLPYLVWQYGLGELTPYLPNLNQLINEGIKWQRIRGTPGAIEKALGWLGYAGRLEEEPTRRKRWNRFQLELSRVRDNDLPDLERIAGVVSLSPPKRSQFVRGYRGYDIRAAETSFRRTSDSLTGDHSGVYLPGIFPKWSFGRQYEFDHQLTEGEVSEFGPWIPPVEDTALWVEMNSLWATADYGWNLPAVQARGVQLASHFAGISVYLRFTNAIGGTIGYIRAVRHNVEPALNGEFTIGTQKLRVSATPTGMIVQGRTGFGDGDGQQAVGVSVIMGASPASGIKPGKLWLSDGELIGGTEIAAKPISIAFGKTVRERIRFFLRF